MKNLFFGTFFLLLGTLLLLDNLGYLDSKEVIHDYWPLILILWGISILARTKSDHKKSSSENIHQSSEELLHYSNIFGDIFLKITSQSFKGGSINTIFGDCEIDLSNSSLAQGVHELKIHSVFGDSYIKLNKDLPVRIKSNTILGKLSILGEQKSGFSPSYKFESQSYVAGDNKLNIIINKIFGDIIVE